MAPSRWPCLRPVVGYEYCRYLQKRMAPEACLDKEQRKHLAAYWRALMIPLCPVAGRKERSVARPPPSSGSTVQEESEPELQYLFDPDRYLTEPITDRDYLNRTWAVKALARWLGDKDQHQHITLGLFGNWGAGKSTFLHLLETELCGQPAVAKDEAIKAMQALDQPAQDDALAGNEEDKVNVIWGTFNAWEYERSDNIQAGLAQEVVAALRRDLTAFQTLVLTLQYAWAQYRSSWLWSLIILLVLVPLVVWGSGSLLEKAGWLGKDNLWLLDILPAELLAIWKLYPRFRTIFAHPLASDFNTYLRLPDFGKYLGAIPVLRKQIATLIALRLQLNRPSLYRTACDQGLVALTGWFWG